MQAQVQMPAAKRKNEYTGPSTPLPIFTSSDTVVTSCLRRYLISMLRTIVDIGRMLSHARRRTHSRSHAGQPTRELWVLLLDFQLGARSFGVGQSVDDFALGTRELGGAFEVFERFCYFALLQEQLSHGGDGNVAFRVDWRDNC